MHDRKATRSARPDLDIGVDKEIRAGNKRRIILAASKVFAAKGFHGARIAEIATVANLPKANVYYYYPTKEDLYSATFAPLLDQWDRALDILRVDADPAVAMREYVKAKLTLGRRNPIKAQLFTSEMLRGGIFLSQLDHTHIAKSTASSVKVLEVWIAEGKIRKVNPHHLLFMLWAATQYYFDYEPIVKTLLQVKRLTGAHYEQALDSIVETVLGGILIS